MSVAWYRVCAANCVLAVLLCKTAWFSDKECPNCDERLVTNGEYRRCDSCSYSEEI